MKFPMSAFLVGLAAISVAASPMPMGDISMADPKLARDWASSVAHDHQVDFVEPVHVQARETIANADLEAPSAGLGKRAKNSKFKIHVVNGASRVLGIIIIDYTINSRSKAPENISASFNKLTNVRTKGKIVATHFQQRARPQATPQHAVFDFATGMVSGVIDLTLDGAGTVTGIASSAGVHLSGAVVARKLLVFNENNANIGSINL
ncbi:hypothetical protein CGMCC3_g17910 [Colletotrichum fructicola]|uniref:uncharacterized protein n=1 Tax=Colletotrichum siamense TaxID=690259 RepID=UPI0013253A04|nr:uncharacterized protein CGMCC3_g17910 [Colletotrichum fructicola]XP_036487795.1 uncharacterized protein CGCS363_v015131 [Colletotrichum siamense]KAE9565910.1 hypothetical protein CGMCC3_g17910 [Colletotrichum fructicola]KAF4417411.1 hypothetical protein CFRS1_v015950 [Colletotrichum fructicola]KAF4881080.1 hypothetical protein CGCFRS4_v015914 [Colletotrichum fructicola]KAF5482817.1 hypothetical protein CGCS363_v015131 [Colletotrichum siamense]